MKRALKGLKIGAAAAAGIICLVAGALAFFTATEVGIRALHAGLERALPGFRAQEFSGTLLHLRARGVEYADAGISFEGDFAWDLSFSELLSGRITLNSVRLSDAAVSVQSSSPAAGGEAAPSAPSAATETTTAGAGAASRLRAPLPVRVKALELANVRADIDGNEIFIGRFSTDALWRRDQVAVERMTLSQSSFKPAPSAPSSEPLGAVLTRTFAAPVLPAIPAVSMPVDVTLKSFELDRFTIKGEPGEKDAAQQAREKKTESSGAAAPGAPAVRAAAAVQTAAGDAGAVPAAGPAQTAGAAAAAEKSDAPGDQVIDHAAFSFLIKDGTAKIDDFSVRMMNIAAVGDLSVGLDARHELRLAAVVSAELPREAIPTGYAPEPIEVEASSEERAKFFERLNEATQARRQAVAERRARRIEAAKAAGTLPQALAQRAAAERAARTAAEKKEQAAQERRRRLEARQAAALRFKQRVQAWRNMARGMLVKTIPRPPVIVALNVQAEGALAETVVVRGATDNIPGVETASFELRARPAETGLPLEVKMRAPWVYASGVLLKNFVFDLQGRAVDYQFSAAANAYRAMGERRMLRAQFSMKGRGTEVKAHVNELFIDSNAGRIDISGGADWAAEPRFSAMLSLSDVHTREILPETPLTASGSFAAWGVQKNGAWYASLQDLTILGEMRGELLALTGSFETRGNGVVQTPGLNFSVGRNTFDVAGRINVAADIPELSLKADIDAPDFALVDPNLKGSIRGHFDIAGTTELPVMNIDITARDIGYLGTTLKSGRISGRVRSQATVSGEVKLTLTDLQTTGAQIKNASVTLKGSEWRHELTVKAEGSPASVDLRMTGAYRRLFNNWTGSFAALSVRTNYGTVKLEKPVRLELSGQSGRLSVGTGCLTHPQARACLAKAVSYDLSGASDTPLSVTLEKFDLSFIKTYFPGNLDAQGIIKARADFTVPAAMADLPRGTLQVTAQNISTTYRMALDDFKLGFDALSVTMRNTSDAVEAGWRIDIADNGDIEGALKVRDIFGERALDGNLRMRELDATIVNSFLSPGEAAEGRLYGDLRFAGNVDEPLVYGTAGIEGARLDSTKMPFEMLASDMNVRFSGSSSTLSGELRTPRGEVQFSGEADWRTLSEGRAVINARTKNLRLVMPPEIEIDLSTDVRCEASSQLIRLDGVIEMPWARVAVTELPASAVDVSPDVVRTDRPRPKKKDRSNAIPVESNLFVNIGDDVRVEAMGLKARLTGRLHVIQDKGALGLTGQISVPNGRFKAYGQDLIVRRGVFQFTGEAANPTLDLEAVRNPERTADDVVAGVRVQGTANYPQVSIFTDPEKSETEALSYLLRGEGLDPSGDSDNTMITSALINLGLSQGSQVFESLGDAVGISGLGLDTEGVGDSSQLVVSGYVLPGLKVKYGVGIFDSLATLTLRYRVIPRLYVEAVSGVDQALDLLYAFEF